MLKKIITIRDNIHIQLNTIESGHTQFPIGF